ncbi:polymeric immunoglobulin receptor-like isoform 1-T1 [Fundulus diaphanus]
MAVSLTFLLIFTLITGTDGALTMIPAKAGASVSIPCLYDSQYRNHVKYLCEGYYWNHCSYATKTNSHGSGKYSISDDKNQTIFNVTIKHLTVENTHYWCAVEINGGSDVRQYFQLSVTTDTSSLYVDNQEVTGFIGEDVTINCHYRTSGEIKWCKLGRNCVTGVSGSIDGTTVTINTTETSVFTVTMRGLMPRSSGWYYCDKENFQMPVHLTVTAKPTGAAPTTVTTAGEMTTEGQVQTTRENRSQVVKVLDHYAQRSFSVQMSLIIPLSLQIFIVAVSSLFLLILRIKLVKPRDSTASKLNEGEETYSVVIISRTKALQVSAQTHLPSLEA